MNTITRRFRKTVRFWLMAYYVEAGLGSLHKWSHFKVHKRRKASGFHRHLVWGPISIIVSQPQIEMITVCADCHEAIERVGEDYLDYCAGCQQIEGDTIEMSELDYEAQL